LKSPPQTSCLNSHRRHPRVCLEIRLNPQWVGFLVRIRLQDLSLHLRQALLNQHLSSEVSHSNNLFLKEFLISQQDRSIPQRYQERLEITFRELTSKPEDSFSSSLLLYSIRQPLFNQVVSLKISSELVKHQHLVVTVCF